MKKAAAKKTRWGIDGKTVALGSAESEVRFEKLRGNIAKMTVEVDKAPPILPRVAGVKPTPPSHDDFEASFWGNCANTYGEETKQLRYLEAMGFQRHSTWRSAFNFDAKKQSMIDIGGGPASALLKFENRGRSLVIDPMEMPHWVLLRYSEAFIDVWRISGEKIEDIHYFDLAFIYNCLQHCEDPELVIANARKYSKALRMFEWLNTPPSEGHPHMLTAAKLDKWTGQKGKIIECYGANECAGTAWVLGGG